MLVRALSVESLVRWLITLAFLAGLVPLAVSPPPARADTIFTVDTTTDAHDSNLFDNSCYNGIDGCSLRAAIEQAFGLGNASNYVAIGFWSGLSGATWSLSLGPIAWNADYTILDGGDNNVTIDGSGLLLGQSALLIDGSHNIIQRLTIRNAPKHGIELGDLTGWGTGNYNTVNQVTLIGNGGAGVYVRGGGGGGQRNTVQNSLMGTTSASVTSCVTGQGNRYGALVQMSAHNTWIQTSHIVCNDQHGIVVDDTGGTPTATQLLFNWIGTNGNTDMGNGEAGVWEHRGDGTTIDGSYISGNGWAGVWLQGSQGAVVTTNFIGLNQAGLAAIPNGHDGVAITDGAHNNTVGGPSVSNCNTISGNTWCGVRIRDGSTHNTIRNNLIGLNAAGTVAIANGQAGIAIYSDDNAVGGSVTGEHQYISGNQREGVYVSGASGTRITQSNIIGLAVDRITPRGNGLQGIMLVGARNSLVTPALVAHNGGAGIAVVGTSATGNLVTPIAVGSNGGLPIDLGNDGATPNGAHPAPSPGPNHWLPYPVVTSFAGNTVQGTSCAHCKVYVYLAVGDPAACGGGGVAFLGPVVADGTGRWNATLTGGYTVARVTLLACQGTCTFSGGTSELSPRPVLLLPLLRRR